MQIFINAILNLLFLRSFHKKITGETPEVRSDKRKPREESEEREKMIEKTRKRENVREKRENRER